MRKPVLLLISFILPACAQLLQEPMMPETAPDDGLPITRSVSSQELASPDEMHHNLQTDHLVMLLNHISMQDSIYVQTLTESDMVDLGITSEENSIAEYFIKQLNEKL